MFKLDHLIFNWIYQKCYLFGSTFGFGAFEGFIMYALVILACITTADSKKKNGVKK